MNNHGAIYVDLKYTQANQLMVMNIQVVVVRLTAICLIGNKASASNTCEVSNLVRTWLIRTKVMMFPSIPGF